MPRLTLACLLAVLGAITFAPGAVAHTSLVESFPTNGATLEQSPAVSWLRLTDPIDPNLVTVTLTDSGGAQVPLDRSSTEGTTLTQPLPALGNGTYTLAYRIVSADGHPVTGTVSFAVVVPAPSPQAPPPLPPPPAQAPPPPESHAGWWIGGAVLVLALLAVAAGVIRRLGRER